MKILHTSFECYPLAKVGGLADVVGALPKYQNKLNHEASVIMPCYANAFTQNSTLTPVFKGEITIGTTLYAYEIHKITSPKLSFTVYGVAIEGLLDRPQVYGYEDETIQYLSFQLAVLDWLLYIDDLPDVLHCHDHHTSLIPFFINYCYAFKALQGIPTVVTIHNAQYQGVFGHDKLHLLPAFDKEHTGLLDWYGQINPMAAGIKCASRVNTVSPSYMEELKGRANGLEGLLRAEDTKCLGILNGIDTEVWNPETDTLLNYHYTEDTVEAGKQAHKEALCQRFGLDVNKPLFGFIGRLVGEKAADLLPQACKEALEKYDINILVLGSGHKETEAGLEALKESFKGRYNTYIGYDEALSHIIYAGADFLMMPSRVEPCGLNQMYALRYGTIPIVRRTGGLKDTVIDMGDDGFGICHDQASVWDMVYSIGRAVGLYTTNNKFKAMQKHIMGIDNSWERSAQEYIALYTSI